jgi:hypothetical protein
MAQKNKKPTCLASGGGSANILVVKSLYKTGFSPKQDTAARAILGEQQQAAGSESRNISRL